MFLGFIGGLVAFALCKVAESWWAKRQMESSRGQEVSVFPINVMPSEEEQLQKFRAWKEQTRRVSFR
jgi:hypothetical protein